MIMYPTSAVAAAAPAAAGAAAICHLV